MKLYSVGVACAIIVVACGGETNPNADVVADRPNAIGRDVPNPPGIDVPNPPGMDVPNPPVDSPSCPPGQLICGASMVCADTQVDNNNCGMCDNACAAGRQCVAGACACNMGTTQCGMACSELMTDSANCGACGTACAAGQMCVSGTCRIGCQLPNTVCRDAMGMMTCSNPATDLNNCGVCGTVCAAANGTPSCVGGACGVASCAAGFGNCDNMAGNGCETNTNSLISDCGRCGNVCPAPANGVAACAMGTCGLAGCLANFGNCDMNAANGCEVSLASAVANCGACGTVCPAPANAAAACAMGACGIGACNAGFANCDAQANNGCEINTQTNAANCGACGNVCGAGQACTNGVCGCPAPTFACVAGGVTSCVDRANDSANCGGCGNRCPAGQFCAAGLCGIVCGAPNTVCVNGGGMMSCVNRASDRNNCGACNNVCPGANATPNCVGSVCGLASCNPGFANCDNNTATGCEVNILNTVSNCGACGNACTAIANGAVGCAAGACRVGSCNAGFANCDAVVANGCETATTTNILNCGACGTVCAAPANATAGCAAGACGIGTCNSGFGNCDNMAANGCEVNLLTANNNCGACGVACALGQTCDAGACRYSPVGPQQGVPVATVTTGGWTQCYVDNFNSPFSVANLQAQCTQPEIMEACRRVANPTLQLLAQAPRTDVFFVQPNIANPPAHNANGSNWYFSTNFSLGFAPAGAALNRNTCDITAGADRMCIHTSGSLQGYRCGSNLGLQGGVVTHERVFYQRVPRYRPAGPQLGVPLATVTSAGWAPCYLDNFNSNFNVGNLQAQCNRTQVMEACRLTGGATLQLLAQAPRVDTFFVQPNLANPPAHNANGSNWYFSTVFSLGFAPAGAALNRSTCDTTAGTDRMCVHTVPGFLQGYRCGNNTGLQSGNMAYERIFFHQN